jgi:hypothetical protein
MSLNESELMIMNEVFGNGSFTIFHDNHDFQNLKAAAEKLVDIFRTTTTDLLTYTISRRR